MILCTLGFDCSDEHTGSDEGGRSKAEVLASEEEGSAKTAQVRGEIINSNPDAKTAFENAQKTWADHLAIMLFDLRLNLVRLQV